MFDLPSFLAGVGSTMLLLGLLGLWLAVMAGRELGRTPLIAGSSR